MAVFGSYKIAIIFAVVFLATIPSEALRGGLIRSGRAVPVIGGAFVEEDLPSYFNRPTRKAVRMEFMRFGRSSGGRLPPRNRRGDSEEEESARFG
uniref:Uncharacterized protein n=1 Tax=Panagrellus redivivus TaxID=6233 RepID=A0A7E4V7N0_PANRE